MIPLTGADKAYGLRGRYIVIFWIGTMFFLPGALWIQEKMYSASFGAQMIALQYYSLTLFALILAITLLMARLPVAAFFRQRASAADTVSAIWITTYLFLFGTASIVIVFYPISLIYPEFVQWWLIDLPSPLIAEDGALPVVLNVLSYAGVILVAPFLEELAFRGILLHRWASRFGLKRAVILSSIVFGLVHPDILGATVFSLGMCVIYLRTQSLLLVIACHALNNLVASLWEIIEMVTVHDASYFSLEYWQSQWYVGVIALSLVIAWTYLYFRRQATAADRIWALPKLQ